nr:hypothetical protein [Tanacetum cinerariifolium]
PRVTSPTAVEDSMQQKIPELTALSTSLQRRMKGKEVMVESETPKKQKVQEQIDAQVARELEEQLVREDQRRERLPSKAGSSTCDDQLQASSEELLIDGE